MELTQEFRVGISVPDAWKVLTNVERIAPMLPGAQLQEVEGDEYRGVVKVKVGPITAQYKGQATFLERDEAAGRVVLKATGRDTRGQGNANAVITANMSPDGDGTKVTVVTDLTVTGKVAQFGRGVLAEVSAKLMGQFVDSLEADLAASGRQSNPAGDGAGSPETAPNGPAAAAAGNGSTASTAAESAPGQAPGSSASETSSPSSTGPAGVRRISGPEVEPVDLVAVAGRSTLKRLIPLVAAMAVIAVLLARRRASRRRASEASGGLSRLAGHLPSAAELTSRLSSAALTGHLPDVRAAIHLPSPAELSSHLPDLRGHDVLAAVHRNRP
jgi:carbon monoxide dehydrogenase subunit G